MLTFIIKDVRVIILKLDACFSSTKDLSVTPKFKQLKGKTKYEVKGQS